MYILQLIIQFQQGSGCNDDKILLNSVTPGKISTIQHYLSGFTKTTIHRGAPGQEKTENLLWWFVKLENFGNLEICRILIRIKI